MDRIAAAICIIALCHQSAATCHAQVPTQGSVQAGRRPSLLVLKNGRVITGIVSPRAGGYDVGKGIGRMFISEQTVRFEATDMADAYRKMRKTFTQFTPEVHIEIARWCMANNQVPAARQELLDALHLESHNQTARAMLRRLESQEAAKKKTQKPTTLAERRIQQFMRTEHESLGGLTDQQAAIFTSRVQPILEKGCGNSSCHGSRSTTGFVLTRSRGRTSRLVSERNLAVVLKHVRFDQPSVSPLIKAIDEPHTRDGRPIFSGPVGKIQRKIILDWVASVARKDATARTTLRPTSPATVTPKLVPTPASARSPIQTVSAESAMQSGSTAGAATRQLRQGEQELLKQVRSANEDDPFDPDVFNRRYHGTQTQTKPRTNK